ncbi:hypothetical protein [Bradyrhizobium genosp. SA-3]|uniref:hypothetical protein n=1 Tax=Bradyrhizobium genosp. SA-3 TaxID=508868 RepID=UPI001028E99C|nr:hypothetical protein [Bradyrhizobium genosp. SA-3]
MQLFPLQVVRERPFWIWCVERSSGINDTERRPLSRRVHVEINAKAAIHEVGDEGPGEVIPRNSEQNGAHI